jgi:hypothetical protein
VRALRGTSLEFSTLERGRQFPPPQNNLPFYFVGRVVNVFNGRQPGETPDIRFFYQRSLKLSASAFFVGNCLFYQNREAWPAENPFKTHTHQISEKKQILLEDSG